MCTYLSLQSDTEDNEIETAPGKFTTSIDKIESTRDGIDLSEDEDDVRFRLYLSEVIMEHSEKR